MWQVKYLRIPDWYVVGKLKPLSSVDRLTYKWSRSISGTGSACKFVVREQETRTGNLILFRAVADANVCTGCCVVRCIHLNSRTWGTLSRAFRRTSGLVGLGFG